MSGQRTIAERLAHRLRRPVAAADRRRAALHVLDWTGCALAGRRSLQAHALASVFGCGDDTAAIFFWGGLGNLLEMDDVDKRALLHPGPVIVPAALIGCRRAGVDAAAFLDAVVRGYEATIRVGRAVGPGHYRFWHNTATCGPFGAAAGLAATLGDVESTADALGLAGTQSSGLWQVRHEPRAMAKQLHGGRAAHAGLVAWLLAEQRFAGVRGIFEGEQGFFAATCPGADPEDILRSPPDAPWAIYDVSFKPWPACRHAHPAIDAALALRAGGVAARDVVSIVVRGYRDALLFCDKPAPTDSLSARFSLQHAVAAALVWGPPTLAHFEGAALVDADLASMRARISVREDAAITAAYPARFGAGLDVVLAGGATRRIDVGDALGDPENPASDELIRAKAETLLDHSGLDRNAARALIAAALALPEGAPGAFARYGDALFAAAA